MVTVSNVTKNYGTECVLDHITVEFQPGEIYGLVGRNGSGKTMLLKAMAGLIPIDSGSIVIDDKKIGVDLDHPENTGILIEEPGFLGQYSRYANLKMLASINNKISDKTIREYLQLVGLDSVANKRVCKYSLGMRQRLGIAQALMEDPQLILLDEPMNGLDDTGVEDIRNILKSFRQKDAVIIIATHSKEDIYSLCDKIYRMNRVNIPSEMVLSDRADGACRPQKWCSAAVCMVHSYGFR